MVRERVRRGSLESPKAWWERAVAMAGKCGPRVGWRGRLWWGRKMVVRAVRHERVVDLMLELLVSRQVGRRERRGGRMLGSRGLVGFLRRSRTLGRAIVWSFVVHFGLDRDSMSFIRGELMPDAGIEDVRWDGQFWCGRAVQLVEVKCCFLHKCTRRPFEHGMHDICCQATSELV